VTAILAPAAALLLLLLLFERRGVENRCCGETFSFSVDDTKEDGVAGDARAERDRGELDLGEVNDIDGELTVDALLSVGA
jgi:hypothetical protein